MCKKVDKFLINLIVLWLNASAYLLAQIPATTNDGKKVILYENGIWQYENESKTLYKFLPKINHTDVLVHRTAYSLVYDTIRHLAKWTMYELKKEFLSNSNVERYGKFFPDPLLIKYTNLEEDYKNSGYDRGHLVPAADMAYSELTMKESFYFSNIAPQVPSFNRGIWKKLEEQVRKWASENDYLYIITGSVITDTMKKIGIHNISIPDYFFKIIANLTSPDMKMIGFIIPNKKSNLELMHYAVSVDSIEKITNIDFFPHLSDDIEEKLEKYIQIKEWNLYKK